jgi:GT2 family glycosyltransferase/SAM-dependent methyltransferase
VEFTGERYVPTQEGQIKYEHLHRYALSKEFAAGKIVLDLACGEGYGTALLAQAATSVIGVDLSPATIEHARHKYYSQNLTFLVGRCEAVPLPDASVDLVTCFETLEHHDKHEEMMGEIKRVLRPGGILIISSPNRLTYSDEPNYSNPFHVKELYFDEFKALLDRYFKCTNIYGQRLAAGSFVYTLQESRVAQLKTYSGDLASVGQQLPLLSSPIYFIAVCSDDAIIEPESFSSIYVDPRDDLMKKAELERARLETVTADLYQQEGLSLKEREKLSAALSAAVARAAESEAQQAESAKKVEQLEVVKTQLHQVEVILSQKNEHLSTAFLQIAEKSEQLSAAHQEINRVRAKHSSIEGLLRRKSEELYRKTVELAEALARISGFKRQAKAQAEKLALTRAEAAELEDRASDLADQLRQRPDVSDLHLQLSHSEAHSRHLSSLLAEARARLASKKEILNWISTSRSWRSTARLRHWSLGAARRRARADSVLRGFLDAPAEEATAKGYLEIVGWVYSTVAPINRIAAFLDNFPLGTLSHGELRPDAAEAHAPTTKCGFSRTFQLDEFLNGPRLLMVRVTDDVGNTKDFFRTITVKASAEDVLSDGFPLPRETISKTSETGVASSANNILIAAKTYLESMSRISLESFLTSNAEIELPSPDAPKVSIILVLYNRAELTLQCLYSILHSSTDSFEIIIVDNASTDETHRLLGRTRGAQIISNKTNLHYLRACNQALNLTRGECVLLLNNDAQLVPGSIRAALQTLNGSDDVGAVGGKIILPDGTLQEAGSIIWQDGSCLGYGRGDSPYDPAYMFKRDVDFCSAAFLLTRRELLLKDGGFDEAYVPAYYEETDYCVRLWRSGKRVVYDPNVIVLHYEFGSSSSQRKAIRLQADHQNVFVKKHTDWLRSQQPAKSRNVLVARTHHRAGQRRILFLDDRVPHLELGSGFPRSNRILWELVKMKHDVTLYPTNFPHEDWAGLYRDIPREVEVMLNHGWTRFEEFTRERRNYYDLVFVSRPHNMAQLGSLLANRSAAFGNAKVIYDAEALFSFREIEQLRIEGKEPSHAEQQKLVDAEVKIAENCEAVISVSARESREFAKRGLQRVHTLGHALSVTPTQNGFAERRDILFVGAVHSGTSPNADSMYWFSEKVLPLIQQELGQDIKLIIAGPTCSSFHKRLSNGNVKPLGKVDDLTPLYNQARLFVAPTRFSAGIPLKVLEAAAHGLPTVATFLTGAQLEWQDEEELLLADDPKSFANACIRLYNDPQLWGRLRQTALKRVAADCSPEAFSEALKAIIG